MGDGIAGRVTVITGGTGALGREVVLHFAEAGARVYVPWFDEGETRELEGLLREAPPLAHEVRLGRVDVTDEGSVADFFEAVRTTDGGTEILLNIVGGFSMGPIEETDLATWNRMLAMNGTSAFLCSRAVVPDMRKAGRGRIVNVSAAPALERGAARMSAYAASKAAVLNLTYSLAAELRVDGITVNAIVPTAIDTPLNRRSMPDADRSDWVKPLEIARVLRFLAGDDGGIVTGSALALAGGGRRQEAEE